MEPNSGKLVPGEAIFLSFQSSGAFILHSLKVPLFFHSVLRVSKINLFKSLYCKKIYIYISLCFVKIHLPSLLHVSLFTIILCLSLIHFYSISLPLCIRFSLSFRVFLIFLVLSSYSYIILDLFFIFFIFFIVVLAFIFLFPQ